MGSITWAFQYYQITTNNVLRQIIQSKIADGEYNMGIPILSNNVKKIVIKDGKVKEKIFKIDAKKIPLDIIRKQTLEKHEKFMRCTRHQILSDTQVETRLKIINEFNPNMTTERNVFTNMA